MKNPPRYIFDRSFDEVKIEKEVMEVIVPTFSEGELQAAQEVAFQEGILEGRRLERQEIEAQLLQSIPLWTQRLEEFINQEHLKQTALQQSGALLAHRLAVKICRDVVYPHAAHLIEDNYQTATAFMLQGNKVLLQIHPDLEDSVKSRLQGPIEKGVLEIVADPVMNVGDCQLSWPGGGAEFKLNETIKKIDAYIQDYTEDKDHG